MRGVSGFSLKATVVALAMAVGLAGCGGPAGTGATDPSQGFSGTWSVDAVTNEGKALTDDELEVVKAMGIYLTLDEDGNAVFEMFGSAVEGTWEAQGATAASLKLEEGDESGLGVDETTITLADDHLKMESEGQSMSFVRIDPSEKTTMDLGSLADGSAAASADAAATTDEESTEAAPEKADADEGEKADATGATDAAGEADAKEEGEAPSTV